MPDDLTYAFGHPYFYTIPDFIADPNANAVPGTFADADANANGHCNCDGDSDNNTRAVVNAHGYRNADRNRHAEAYAQATSLSRAGQGVSRHSKRNGEPACR